MHGGAKGSGARTGNRNALKHGRYSQETIKFRRCVRELVHEAAGLVVVSSMPVAPFAHGLRRDAERSGHLGYGPAVSKAVDHQTSTVQAGSRILMDVHPGLRAVGWRCDNHSLPVRPRVDNLHSNDI